MDVDGGERGFACMDSATLPYPPSRPRGTPTRGGGGVGAACAKKSWTESFSKAYHSTEKFSVP